MAMMLQLQGVARDTISPWLAAMPQLADLYDEVGSIIIDHMLAEGIVAENDGRIWFDQSGEKIFGQKNFMDLLSVFTSAPVMEVIHGRDQIATLDKFTFWIDNDRAVREGRPTILTLAGRQWIVKDVNYRQRQVHVAPCNERGRSRWMGSGAEIGCRLASTYKEVLVGDQDSPRWSKRAVSQIGTIRGQYSWLREGSLVVRIDGNLYECWTFAGTRFNRILASLLDDSLAPVASNAYQVIWRTDLAKEEVAQTLAAKIEDVQSGSHQYTPDPVLADEIKFHEAVPCELLIEMLQARLAPEPDARCPTDIVFST